MKKILIANRGEIAVRIIRTCRELGFATVAVYSEVDRDSFHAKIADESVCIGPAKSSQSYLNIPAIIAAAEMTGSDAIHPGYGFLSENYHFAEICQTCKISFIGPTSDQIRLLGDKVSARKTAKDAGLPLLPGSATPLETLTEALVEAQEIGFPLILKASAGGGGRGMLIVRNLKELEKGYVNCRREASVSFGNSQVYLEKYLENPKHIEVQVFGDREGNAVHLWERDCTVQRRHQKLIEEAPCAFLTEQQRENICQSAVRLIQHVGYEGAGTVEFLLDQDGSFYFMEMNTRIQVEHPVTEEITFQDLIEWQLAVSSGSSLPVKQSQILLMGHSLECRVNAEVPGTFVPTPGVVQVFSPPGGQGVRIESHLYNGFQISPFYDSMIAKVITHAKTRKRAIAKMEEALNEFLIEGVQTNISFLLAILKEKKFLNGRHSTGLIEEMLA
jgi:acetyl-CoA carboxylase biotin carboxylase subunit